MRNVCIMSGAGGHVGGVMIQKLLELRKYDEIRALLVEHDPTIRYEHVSYYTGDVCDIKSLFKLFKGCENDCVDVIHAAGIIDIQKHVSKQMYQVNVNGTKNMLKMSERYHIHNFLYISSVHAIPELAKPQIIKEVTHFSPSLVIGGYAKTKAEATQAVLDAGKQGMHVVVVHPSGIIGPYSSIGNHLVQMIVDALQGNLPACVKGGYDFVDVRDVVDGCIAALEKGEANQCYILSNRYYEIKDVLDMVSHYGKCRKLPVMPVWLAKISAPVICAFAKVLHKRPLYTSYSLYTLLSNASFSHEKATRELGYHPRDIEITIQDTIQWYRQIQKDK